MGNLFVEKRFIKNRGIRLYIGLLFSLKNVIQRNIVEQGEENIIYSTLSLSALSQFFLHKECALLL